MNFKDYWTTKGFYELKFHKTVKTLLVLLVHFTRLEKPNYTVLSFECADKIHLCNSYEAFRVLFICQT